MSNEKERNQRQRSFGFIGFSAMAHIGLLALLALSPQSRQMLKSTFGAPNGNTTGETQFMDLTTPGSSNVAATQGEGTPPSAEAPREVLLASADDQHAIALPTKAIDEAPAPAQAPAAAPLPSKPAKSANPVAEKSAKPAKPPHVAKAAKSELPPIAVANGDLPAKAAPATEPTHEEETIKPIRIVEPAPAEPLDDGQDALPSSDEMAAAREEKQETPVAAAPEVAAPREEAKREEVKHEEPKAESLVQPVTVATLAGTANRQADNTTHARADKPVAPATAPAPVQAQTQAAPSANGAPGGTANGTQAGHPLAAQAPGPAQNGAVQPAGQPGQTGYGTRPGQGLGFGIPLGAKIRDAGELTAAPGNPLPRYTDEDKLAHRQGTAVVIGRVNQDGSISNVMLERSSGSRAMDRDSVAAFQRWKFMPGQQGYVRKPFTFQLTGEAQEIPTRLRR